MGKPAARMGDMTAHGGVIMLGFPTVLIGGMPAARLGDMHVCPMVTPAVPPIPHVGGPVTLGSPMVLIGGMPAARMGDMLVCVGPPDTIVIGCPTVMIGEGGSGSASGGGGAGGAAASAAKAAGGDGARASAAAATEGHAVSASPGIGALVASALMALSENQESSTKSGHWIEFAFVDKAGLPVGGLPYRFTDVQGKESRSVLHRDGRILRDSLPAGECNVELIRVTQARWSTNEARVGEKVKMNASVEGHAAGTPARFEIYQRNVSGTVRRVLTVKAKTQQTSVTAEWEYVRPSSHKQETTGYSRPEYYFEIFVGGSRARSDLLLIKDFIEIELKDEDDRPLANEEFILTLPDGAVRRGKLDGNGYKKEEGIPPGACSVRFPRFTPSKTA